MPILAATSTASSASMPTATSAPLRSSPRWVDLTQTTTSTTTQGTGSSRRRLAESPAGRLWAREAEAATAPGWARCCTATANGRGGRPSKWPADAPEQDRRDRCGPRRWCSTRPGASGAAAVTGRRCGSCWAGAATLSPHRLWRSTSPEALIVGACDELRARPARRGDQGADRPLRRAAGPASPATGAPHDPPGATHHRPADPPLHAEIDARTTRRTNLIDATASWLTDRPGIGPSLPRSPGELVVCRPVALARRPSRPRRVSPIPPHRGRSPATGSNRSRGPPARTAPSHDRARRAPRRPNDPRRPHPTRRGRQDARAIRRCLKRFAARQQSKLLERRDQPGIGTPRTARQDITASVPWGPLRVPTRGSARG